MDTAMQKILIFCQGYFVKWFKLKLISSRGRWEKAYNRFSKAVALRQTGCHYWDVGFSTKEESVSLRFFNYSYQWVLDFHIGGGAVYIKATRNIKHKCKEEPHKRDTKTSSDAEKNIDGMTALYRGIRDVDEDVKISTPGKKIYLIWAVWTQ